MQVSYVTGPLHPSHRVGCLLSAIFVTLLVIVSKPNLASDLQAANSLALGTSPVVRALFDPEGGMRSVRALDNISFTDWFKSHGGSEASIRRMWDPIAYALGFLNCDDVSGPCGQIWAPGSLLHAWDPTDQALTAGIDLLGHPSTVSCTARPAPCQANAPVPRALPSEVQSLSHPTASSPSPPLSVCSLQISARCMLSIFQFFATKTDASVLRMLNGSPAERLLQPIAEYVQSKGGRIHTQWGCR